ARVAALASVLGAEGARGGFVATLSGGGAGLTADLAARHGVPLAAPSPATADRLRTALPDGAYIGNPLDINTGDAAAVYAALGDDPAVRYLIEPWQLPWPTESPEYHWQRAGMERLRAMSQTTGLPVLIASVAHQPVSDWMRELAADGDVWVSPSLELTLAALGRLALPARSDGDLPGASASGGSSTTAKGIVAEAPARRLLEAAGVPVVRGAEVADEQSAQSLAASLEGPFAVKLSLAAVAHKERVGGVLLGVPASGVADACTTIRANAIAAGVTDGSDVRFLVTEMVSGPELLVGVVRDPLAGPSVTVAVGGWAAEAGAVFGTVPLPAARATIDSRIAEWGLVRLVGAERAESLAAFLVALGEAATGDLAEYREIELNPVMLARRGATVVDALLIR
ncbi:MAG: acetate--CoA ligase family protein, partial [Microbacteriaceae bacterium]|nr:acetate--CoA ligase family protein [Microbacteriaceae bacterium]